MHKRLSITISGAVSLGSYEAGVLYEIITAIGQHNNTCTNETEKIYIDVLTGASAGGMTAAIAAQKLLYEANAFRSAQDNPLYKPWVEDITLQGLLKLSQDEDSGKSIFSSDLVENISRRYLTDRYQAGIGLTRVRHPACADRIKLMLALSNLDGVDYEVKEYDGTPFVYSRFEDEFFREFVADVPADDTFDKWDPVRNAAIACGAFPFAFRVKQLQRDKKEYINDCQFPPTAMAFGYTDGGVFQNEPLGQAKKLVNDIDQHQNSDSRFYLYVAPGAKESMLDMKNPLRAGEATLWPTALALVKAIFHQSRFQEWVMAEEMNTSVNLLNQRAVGLQQVLLNNELKVADLQAAATGLISLLFPGQAGAIELGNARTRLRQQFQTEFNTLAGKAGNVTAATWIDSVLVLEKAADLANHDEMKIYAITAKAEELAGDLFCNFGGFFDKRFRQHDYDQGRYNARRFLSQHAATSGPCEIGPIRYPNPEPLPTPDPNIGTTTMDQLDRSLRVEMKEQILDRTSKLLTEAGMNCLIKAVVLTFFVRPKINQLLSL